MGSSPLTRGKRGDEKNSADASGLIPAHAGKTRYSDRTPAASRAHPRSRGENSGLIKPLKSASGSSPLTRGKPSGQRTGWWESGLIPAHAGKTRNWPVVFGDAQAHPRSRGENVVCFFSPSEVQGSSPLTRGKPRRYNASLHRGGLIPAHAGKTSRSRRAGRSWKAHPRSRGENLRPITADGYRRGSSPLTRGKPGFRVPSRTSQRLIPAHAGKTSSETSTLTALRAHPRSRGENRGDLPCDTLVRGSSPLTRGKRGPREQAQHGRGLIPAHAGKT